jgi:hypothetical protein
MTRRPPAALLATLGFLLLLVILLVAGALLVRSILTESFANGSERLESFSRTYCARSSTKRPAYGDMPSLTIRSYWNPTIRAARACRCF